MKLSHRPVIKETANFKKVKILLCTGDRCVDFDFSEHIHSAEVHCELIALPLDEGVCVRAVFPLLCSLMMRGGHW